MNWTRDKPSQSGYYYYATSVEDWDLYRTVPVERVENSDGVKFRMFFRPHGWNENIWVNVLDSEFDNFIWYGPLPKPTRPENLG